MKLMRACHREDPPPIILSLFLRLITINDEDFLISFNNQMPKGCPGAYFPALLPSSNQIIMGVTARSFPAAACNLTAVRAQTRG